ncbi:MAG: carbohydrate-binding domain-containing protein [Chloroflexi bacterium]|nr:carbohydrate-binding domain-containing protein [Chloroflexota bacterium]MCC6893128.1 carbohydrate-binding domain-containing protein [Anaerolineae bacterium]
MKRLKILLVGLMFTLLSATAIQAQDSGDTITLNGDSISVSGNGAVVDGSTVTITAAGTYTVSGTLTDGQLAVDSEGDGAVTIILNGVNISSSTSAAINIINADSAEIVLADGTQNVVSDAAAYVYANPEDDEPNAAVFSDDDLTISGTGSLTVTGSYNDGIASKDSLTIISGNINVTAADDGIRGKNDLHIIDGTFVVTAGGDGFKADNEDDPALGTMTIDTGSIQVTSGGDALSAETALTVNGGTFMLASGGGSTTVISEDLSAKGVKSGGSIVINAGTFTVDSADDTIHTNGTIALNGGTYTLATGDDAIHADVSIEINGGDIDITRSVEGIEAMSITFNGGDIHLVSSDDGINAAGDLGTNYLLTFNGGTIVVNATGDGLDSNGSIAMNGGTVIVHGPTENFNGALDYDGSFAITGGTLVAAGSAGMPQSPGMNSSQNSLLLILNEVQPAGTLVNIKDSAGNSVLTFAPAKAFQTVAFSSPDLVIGQTYTISLGGISDGVATDGLYTNGTYAAGTEYSSFTVSNAVTQIGESRRRPR